MRETPEGKLRHEQVMYWDKCIRLRDFRKPTIAAVQGTCAAAGLMLASMCDLIVASDDAKFSNPVARMTGVGVELLVEPWELGPRKAKEFLLCADDRRNAMPSDSTREQGRARGARPGSANGRAGGARPAGHGTRW
jgi:enoyl-CoA hydratase/carnithine racemase